MPRSWTPWLPLRDFHPKDKFETGEMMSCVYEQSTHVHIYGKICGDILKYIQVG